MIDKLIQGYAKYRDGYFRENFDLLQRLGTEGQNPRTAFITCCDSRFNPLLITNSKPGDLFIIRNVAALIPPFQEVSGWHGTSAAIEYAVRHLKVDDIIVMGHSDCGGIKSLLAEAEASDPQEGSFIPAWMSIAKQARANTLDDPEAITPERKACACEKEAVKLSLSNLKTFPWIKESIEQGRLTLHGWYYDLVSGEVLSYRPESNSFKPVLCE